MGTSYCLVDFVVVVVVVDDDGDDDVIVVVFMAVAVSRRVVLCTQTKIFTNCLVAVK